MFEPLDGPSTQIKLSAVGTVTVVEAKVGASRFTDRKVVTLQPTGKIYVYFGDGITTPSAATVAANGLIHFKDAKESYEAGERQPLFLLSVTGSVDVIVVERA
jgi:hypothetical protein